VCGGRKRVGQWAGALPAEGARWQQCDNTMVHEWKSGLTPSQNGSSIRLSGEQWHCDDGWGRPNALSIGTSATAAEQSCVKRDKMGECHCGAMVMMMASRCHSAGEWGDQTDAPTVGPCCACRCNDVATGDTTLTLPLSDEIA